MKHSIYPTLAILLALTLPVLANPAFGQADRPAVDPSSFRDKPAYASKRGTAIAPAQVRMIVPGMNKAGVYRVVGTPHFGEAISRRFDYVLNLMSAGEQPLRCRMRVVFGRPEQQPITSDHSVVTRVLWQTQACADRVAAG